MKKKLILAAALLAAAAALCLWYTRPMTLDELCPGLERDKITLLTSIYFTYENGSEERTSRTINLSGDQASDAIGKLFQILDARTYRRSLSSLLPRMGGKIFTGHNPYWWDFTLGGGLHLSMDSFFPHMLDLSYDYSDSETQVFCTVADQEAFYREVYLFFEGLNGKIDP